MNRAPVATSERIFFRATRATLCVWLAMLVMCYSGTAATIGDVVSIVNRIENKVENVQTKLTTVKSNVDDVNDKADEIVSQVRKGVAALSTNVKTLIDDAITDAQKAADDQLDGLEDFVQNDAADFRAELLTFIGDMETLGSQLMLVTDCPEIPDPSLNLSVIRDLINEVPDRALYPVFKIYDPNVGCLLSDALADLNAIASGISNEDTGEFMLANAEIFRTAARGLQLRSYALKMSAKIAEGISEEFGDAKFDIGIHGYVHLEFETNIPLTIAKISTALSDMLKNASEFVLNKLEGYELEAEKAAQEQTLADILAGLNALDALVSAAATQSSVDALASSVTSSFSSLQTSVGGRASQESFDEFTQRADGGHELEVRMRVESELIRVGPPLSLFYLPEASGGLLETVRTITSETIDQHVATGLYSGTIAQSKLQEGDVALGVSDYRTAYDRFREAYREAVSWPLTVSVLVNEAGNGVTLNWNAEHGKTYTVETTEDLVEWAGAHANLEGADGQAKLIHTPAAGEEFYRVSAVKE